MAIKFSGDLQGKSVTLIILRGSGAVVAGPETVSSWGSAPVDPGDPVSSSWAGPTLTETLTVTVDEVFPGGRNFAPLPMEYRIRVSGASVGDTPDTSIGTQSGSDGQREAAPDGENAGDPRPDVGHALDLTIGFQAIDRTFSKLHYVLHTGDTGQYRNTRLGSTSHGDKAFQYGQNPGHVYSNPGTYTNRSIYVYDNEGNWGTLALDDLVVENPDDVFNIDDVIVVSNDVNEDWSNTPPHNSANRVTSIDAAMQLFHNLRLGSADGEGVRVSVKPGTTYNEVATSPNFAYMNGRALFDTWDQSGTCIYDETGIVAAYSESLFKDDGDDQWPFAIKGWKFNFGYDVNSGGPAGGVAWSDFSGRGLWRGSETRFVNYTGATGIPEVRGLRLCFDNVDVQGCQSAVLSTGSPVNSSRYSAWFFNDCLFERNNDYISFQGSNIFHLGTQGLEEYGTDIGGMGRSRIGGPQRGYRGHRNMRETVAWVVYIRACYWESRGGWSGQNSGQTLYAPQPGMRFYEGSNSHQRFGKRYYICDSVFMCPFNVDLGADNPTDRAGAHAVVENCLITVDPANNSESVLTGLGGQKTVRNCQFLCLDTPLISDTNDPELAGKDLSRFETNTGKVDIGKFYQFLEVLYQPRGFGEDLEILNNTFTVLRPDAEIDGAFEIVSPLLENRANGDALEPIENFYNVIQENNVVSAPNLSTPLGSAMDKLALPNGIRVLDIWLKMIWERQTFTLTTPVAVNGTTPLIPYPIDWYSNATDINSYAGSGGLHAVRLPAVPDPGPNDPNKTKTYDMAQTTFAPTFKPEETDAITVNFQAGGFTITNRSTLDWDGEIIILLDRGSTAMQPDLIHAVDQTDLGLYRPTVAEPVGQNSQTTLFDFARKRRPNAGFAISPTEGINTIGAMLPD